MHLDLEYDKRIESPVLPSMTSVCQKHECTRYVVLVRGGIRNALCFPAETHSPLLLRARSLDYWNLIGDVRLLEGRLCESAFQREYVGRILRNEAFQYLRYSGGIPTSGKTRSK